MQQRAASTEYGRRQAFWVSAVLRALLVILLVSTAVFFLMRLVPGDPATMVLGERASEESLAALREKMGLNLPLPQQFLKFLENVFLHGDTGLSLKYNVSCRELVLKAAPVSLILAGMALLLTVICVLLLAFLAANHRDGLLDHLIRVIPAFTQGMPVFWLGLLFILLFSVRLRWFPVGGIKDGRLLYSLVLPAITVSFGQIPPLVRSLRERLLTVLDSDFVTTLRAAGLPKRSLYAHVLRNAFVPTLMLFSVNASYLIGGTLVVEQIFGLRGVGKLLFEAISNRDFPLVQAIALYCAVLVVVISLITELIARAADPRMEGRHG